MIYRAIAALTLAVLMTGCGGGEPTESTTTASAEPPLDCRPVAGTDSYVGSPARFQIDVKCENVGTKNSPSQVLKVLFCQEGSPISSAQDVINELAPGSSQTSTVTSFDTITGEREVDFVVVNEPDGGVCVPNSN